MTKHLTLLLFIGLAFWSCSSKPPQKPPTEEQYRNIYKSMRIEGEDRWLNYFAKWNREYEVIEYQLALHPVSNETAMNGYFDLIKEISFEYAPEYDISIILSKGGKIVKRKRINSKIK